MKIKSLLFIFLIFTQNFVLPFKRCKSVFVNRSDYNFDFFDRGYMNTIREPRQNKIIFAFGYDFIIHGKHKSDTVSKIIPLLINITELEKQKYNPNLIVNILDKLTQQNETNIFEHLNYENKTELVDNYSNETLNLIIEYKDTIEDKTGVFSFLSSNSYIAAIGTGIKTLSSYITGLFTSTSGTAISSVAYINPIGTILAIGVPIAIGIYMNYYNRKINKEIEINKLEMLKSIQVYENLKDKIKKIEWIDNNIVLTAISDDIDCDEHDVQFDFYKGKKYKNSQGKDNYYNVKLGMVNLTCVYRHDQCDIYSCFNNLLKHLENRKKSLNGNNKITQRFLDNCSLEDVPIYDI